jgi:hypothetical protein
MARVWDAVPLAHIFSLRTAMLRDEISRCFAGGKALFLGLCGAGTAFGMGCLRLVRVVGGFGL